MARTAAVVDRSHRGVLAVPGDDRLTWLHLLLTQHVSELPVGAGTEALVLDVNGRVLHHAVVAHVGTTVWLDTEPGDAPVLLDYLEKMRFWSKVEPRDATDELAVLSVVGPNTPAVLDRVGAPLPGPHMEWPPAGRWARAPDAVARHGRRGPPRPPSRQGRLARPARRGRRAPSRDDGVRGVQVEALAPRLHSTRTTARSRTRSAGSRRPCT
jgi:folate-binding Fe-S cluster repair protein YgfZ